MLEQLESLIALKPSRYYTPEYFEVNFPEYYKRVTSFIGMLGVKTEIDGHSDLLDWYKNEAFKCIGL
jgi:hypothetical protein